MKIVRDIWPTHKVGTVEKIERGVPFIRDLREPFSYRGRVAVAQTVVVCLDVLNDKNIIDLSKEK